MKKRALFAVMMAFLAVSVSTAQDLDEILDTYFETIGQEKLLKVNSMKVNGKAMMMGMETAFTSVAKRPNHIYIEVDIEGSKLKQAYDGKTAWMINPMTGSAQAMELTGPDADGLIENADFDGMLWNWEEKGHTVELEGTDEEDGSEVFVIKMTKKNGNIDHYYIDAENYVVLKVKSKVMMQGSEVETEVAFSNFQEVDGIIMPFTTAQSFAGQVGMTIMFDEVMMGEKVDDAIFSMPTEE